MVHDTTCRWWYAALVGALALVATPSRAGDEALYRHAFRHWSAENYQVFVFHHEPIQEDAQKLIELLSSAPQITGANVTVSVVDTAEPMAEPMQTLWYTQIGVEPPWMVVAVPKAEGATPLVWAGSLRAETVGMLLDSPARRKIAEGLLGGDAAVWVLLECGDAIRDETAVDLLAAELKRQELKLSSRASTTNTTAVPVKAGFSLVRVTRNDSAEEFFVTNLLHDASLSHAKPAAFPIYGRGRMLPPLVGKRLSAESIAATCSFITGPCTNKTKAANPGKDLLVSIRWDAPGEPINSASNTSSPIATVSVTPSNAPAPASSLSGTNLSLALDQSSIVESPKAVSYLRTGLIVVILTAVIGFIALRSRRGPAS